MFFLSILDSTGVPMIGGVDALVLGLAVAGPSQGYLAAAAATVGSFIGSLVLFLIARKGGEEYHRRHASSPRGAKFRAWFHEYGLLTVFIPALVPIPLPMKAFVIFAGALEESPITFSLVLLAARIPRYFGLAWLGSKLGPDTLPYLKQHLRELTLFSVALFVVLFLTVRFVHNRRVASARATVSD